MCRARQRNTAGRCQPLSSTATARLQDEHQYQAWEKLWTEDGVYWVPANGVDIDPRGRCRSSTTTARGSRCGSSN